MRDYKKWSANEVRQLQSMVDYGYSINRIARDLDRKPTAVLSKVRSLKLRPSVSPHKLLVDH